jgi:hypothetical protein
VARYTKVGRVFLTLLLAASWNLATVHCAFSAVATSRVVSTASEAADECPMHAAKKAAPEPSKKKGCTDSPCCKTLPASAAATASFPGKLQVDPTPIRYFSICDGHTAAAAVCRSSSALDTGPPGTDAFIEIVVRRSVRAHAPPFLS